MKQLHALYQYKEDKELFRRHCPVDDIQRSRLIGSAK